ncbi:MAG TPA: carboxypeptidase-like regulatory domain-containing protein [Candidatus Polarisedimenticolaceae bacterium]|nr:carboxypeptidase-like regulatory domain-containing protein [Candidatus Polarisedimenticolaceae bacterium]
MLAVVVAASVVGSPAWAAKKKSEPKPAPGSRLDGQVRMADGKSPAKGVVIEVRPLGGGGPFRSQPTDGRGRFSLRGLPYGWSEVLIAAPQGGFIGDQAINLPPGSKVEVKLTLLTRADRPETWWAERHLEPPEGLNESQVAGLAQSSQKLTGVEYWKSPAGIAILISATVVALAVIAGGGRDYTAP